MQTALAISPIEQLEQHLTSPKILHKFIDLLDRTAIPYIRSVLILVESDPKLQRCTPESVEIAALEAASLRLTVLPQVKQGFLVPYKRSKKKEDGTWTSWYEAAFQTHYLGEYMLAMRTGKYKVIDVLPTPAGYSMVHDLVTGDDQLVDESGNPITSLPKIDPVRAGGWYAYFITHNGETRKIHMTKAEIHTHARTYAPGYAAKDSIWQNPAKRWTMERKTALRVLLRWTEKDVQPDRPILPRRDDVIEAELKDITEVLPSGVMLPVDAAFPTDNAVIDPLGRWALGYASEYWQMDTADCADVIRAKELPTMRKHEFMELVTA